MLAWWSRLRLITQNAQDNGNDIREPRSFHSPCFLYWRHIGMVALSRIGATSRCLIVTVHLVPTRDNKHPQASCRRLRLSRTARWCQIGDRCITGFGLALLRPGHLAFLYFQLQDRSPFSGKREISLGSCSKSRVVVRGRHGPEVSVIAPGRDLASRTRIHVVLSKRCHCSSSQLGNMKDTYYHCVTRLPCPKSASVSGSGPA